MVPEPLHDNPQASGPYGLSAGHEALCRRCGLSCHVAVPVNGLPVAIAGLACRFLDRQPDGRFHCTVYEQRFERAPWCRTVERALADGLLAQDCPYARGQRGYRGKVWLHQRLLRTILPSVRRHLVEVGVPEAVEPAAALAFVEQDGQRYRVVWDEENRRHRFVPNTDA